MMIFIILPLHLVLWDMAYIGIMTINEDKVGSSVSRVGVAVINLLILGNEILNIKMEFDLVS